MKEGKNPMVGEENENELTSWYNTPIREETGYWVAGQCFRSEG